jgi:hypothetical protein
MRPFRCTLQTAVAQVEAANGTQRGGGGGGGQGSDADGTSDDEECKATAVAGKADAGGRGTGPAAASGSKAAREAALRYAPVDGRAKSGMKGKRQRVQ